MKNLWNDFEVEKYGKDLLGLRVYTSRLLGREEDLVLHGGGNTSVKINQENIFGETESILYVKGSGWDLATIERAGFSPVRMEALHKLANLDSLSDMDMVKYQRMALIEPSAPNPSVEAILHGIIPYTFVDHTHADAVVTISNSPNGEEKIREIYGPNIMIVPYVMPGFILAKTIYQMTKNVDWDSLEGIVLLNHGVFTFDEDAKKSYSKMVDIVSKAELYLEENSARDLPSESPEEVRPIKLAEIRKQVSEIWNKPVLSRLITSGNAVAFSNLSQLKDISGRGPLTPDHIIRTKRTPVVINNQVEEDLASYSKAYNQYFDQHNRGETKLDQAPRWAILPAHGCLSFGPSPKHVRIISDITNHTRKAIVQAETLGGWRTLGQKDLFEMEYWSLEQAKLKKAGDPKGLEGRIALVTGGSSGIGKACVEELVRLGAAVGVLDIAKSDAPIFSSEHVLYQQCDITNERAVVTSIHKLVEHFGGLDMVITNAGIFPKSTRIEDMKSSIWQQSLDINLTSHQRLIQHCVPFLELGFDPSIVIIGSKNVPAPGPGASAYSVAKAGLTQLGRVAALELGSKGIRVNTIHPNAVYDTAIWTEEVLKARADHYGLSIKEYKTNNVLEVEVTSVDVARLAVAMLGPVFAKITGAQVPIDGGNERVI